MTTLIVGASGATGSQVVEQLLQLDHKIKIIVRSLDNLPETWKNNDQLIIIQASILDINEDTMATYLQDCDSIVSCLGHNISLKGIFGKPRRLVTDSVKLLCNAVKKNTPEQAIKFVLMNTTGNRNGDLIEPISFMQKLVVGMISALVPPQRDNEMAADYLRIEIGQDNPLIEWTAVRPDGLINEDKVTEYKVYPSPIRSAIFDAGQTSRINVAHFMTELITKSDLWSQWKGQMPVIYNKTDK